MWPSEEWASRIYDGANWGLIAGLVLGVISTVLIIWMGNVKEQYLKRELGATGERAGRAEERAAHVEHDNLSLAGQVAGLQTDAATAKAEMARQQTRAAKAETDLIKLQQRVQDRHLTQEEKKRLIEGLGNEPKGQLEIRCPIGIPEARNFALELLDVFKGWNVVLNDRVIIVPAPVGLILLVHSEQTVAPAGGGKMAGAAPERAISILKVFNFKDSRFPVEPQFDPGVQSGEIVLLVGFKP